MLSGSRLRRYLLVLMAVAAVYTAWVFASRRLLDRRWKDRQNAARAAADRPLDPVYNSEGVKIIQFYARDGSLTEGTRSVICYGVLNAKSLRIEPPVPGVFPAFNRCVNVAPQRDTRYTLTAVGADGREVSESFVLSVSADQVTLPKITSFRVDSRSTDYRGRAVFSVSFAAQNVDTIEIEPPAFPTLHGTPFGQFYVAPDKSTTYTLTVTNKRGHKATRQLTISVPPA